MTRLCVRSLRRARTGALAASVAGCLAAFSVAGSAAAPAVPNACTLLAAAAPQKALDPGMTVEMGKATLKTSGSGMGASSYCSEKVGSLTVSLDLYLQDYGFGGIMRPTESHPAGIGGGVLITGTSLKGGVVDLTRMHKGGIYAIVEADGASVSRLTTLSVAVYKLL